MELTNIQELTSFNSDKPTSESKLTLFPCQVEALVSGHLQDTKKVSITGAGLLTRIVLVSDVGYAVVLMVFLFQSLQNFKM